MAKRRQAIVALVIVVVGLGVATLLIPSVRRFLISSNNEKAFALMNHDRTANSRYPALAHQSQLQAYAQNWSNHMAKTGVLDHNTIENHICCWRALGENVGNGPTLEDVEYSFMHSKEHRDNILYPTFTQAGVGVAVSYDRHHNPIYWVTQAFRYPTRTASRATHERTSPPIVRRTTSPRVSLKPSPSPTPKISVTPSPSVFIPPPIHAVRTQPVHHRSLLSWIIIGILAAFVLGMMILVAFGIKHPETG